MPQHEEPSYKTVSELHQLWSEQIPSYLVQPDERAIRIAGILIEGVDQAYGPESSQPLHYHNGQHSRDVMRRELTIWRELHVVIPDRFPLHELGAVLIAGAGHDLEQRSGPNNERNSSILTTGLMRRIERGNFSNDMLRRVNEAIMATTVSFEEGLVTQTHIRQGSRDPLKLTLAYSDINGIAMEGPTRMIRDAAALFMETKGLQRSTEFTEHVEPFVDFLGSQATFLSTRLKAIPEDVAYYFPDSKEAVLAAMVMGSLFRPHEMALKSAEVLRKSDILKEVLLRMSIRDLADITSIVEYLDGEVHQLVDTT